MKRVEHLDVYDITLTTRAPLFIGCGKTYTKKSYCLLPPDRAHALPTRVMLPDEDKLFHLLIEKNLIDRYEAFMLGTQSDLYRFLTLDCRLSPEEIREVMHCTVDASDALDTEHSLKEINAFIRDGNGRVYVPGSSLKGALRTAILTDMLMDEDYTGHSAAALRDREFEGRYFNTLPLRKDRDGQIKNDAVNSILQGVRISDSEPVSDDVMMLAGKIDGFPNGETHSINLCRECIRPGTRLRFKLTLDRSVVGERITGETLRNSIQRFDTFYQSYVTVFAPPVDAADVRYENVLLLGGGAGYFSKTVTYPYLDEKAALKDVIDILSRAFRRHFHERDEELGISPRIAKYARWRGRLYPYGLCEVKIT